MADLLRATSNGHPGQRHLHGRDFAQVSPPSERGRCPGKHRILRRIKYSYACRGSYCALITFEDTEPGKPHVYFMSTHELGELFRGIATGQIKVGPDGMDVRLTFVKKGSAVFTQPVLI